jgi:hypothetical protein
VRQGFLMRARRIRVVTATGLMACVVPLALVACGPTDSDAAGAGTATTTTAATSAACQHVGTVTFDKTKFVLHAGLAYGAFHHFVYSKLKSGAFASGASGRVRNLIEAGLAGAFTVHELKLAKQDAESSPTLCKVVAPFDEATAALSGMSSRLRSGDASSTEVDQVNSTLTSVGQKAASAGVSIPDKIPSAAQLANPGSGN